MKTHRFNTVVIDADQMIYAVGFAAKGEPISYALSTIKSALNKIQEECNAEYREIYVKGKGNFREDIATTRGYKAHRKPTDKPAHYDAIYEYLINVQGAIACDGMEADDAVSIRLYKDYKDAAGNRDLATLILSSGDKDLRNTPGWHYNPRNGEIVWYSDLQSTRHFFYQMLRGDLTDNIKGLPKLPPHICHKYGISKTGVGEGAAKKLMATTATAESAEALVYEMYLHWGSMEGLPEALVKDYILENAQLLWMVREVDSENNPVMFQMNGAAYEEARERIECYKVFKEEEGPQLDLFPRGGLVDPYRVEGWEAEYSDKCDTSLRIRPAVSGRGGHP